MTKPILLDLPLAITTPRLTLRPPQAGDGPTIFHEVQQSLGDLKQWMP